MKIKTYFGQRKCTLTSNLMSYDRRYHRCRCCQLLREGKIITSWLVEPVPRINLVNCVAVAGR